MKKAIILFFLMGVPFFAFAQSGVIKHLYGTVELKNAESANYVPANAGDTVNEDTVIFTSFKSSAVIEVGSTIVTVFPLTRLTLTEIRASAGEEILNIKLRAGRMRVDVHPPAGTRASMSVVSPSASASVRGTSFYFDTRTLRVDHGTVLFKGNRGYTIQTTAGLTSFVEWNGTASAPQSGTAYRSSSPIGLDPSAGAAPGSGAVSSLIQPDTPSTNPGSSGEVDIALEY